MSARFCTTVQTVKITPTLHFSHDMTTPLINEIDVLLKKALHIGLV